MSTTATELMARLQAKGYGNDTEAAQIAALNAAQKRIVNTRRWNFRFTVDSSKTLTIGEKSLTFDSLAETKMIDAIRLELNNIGYQLDYMDREELRYLENEERQNARPLFWTREGATIHFWPVPDNVYKVVVDLNANPTAITTGASTIAIPDAHSEILVWAAIIDITFRERDWDAHNMARQMYSELLAEMLAQYGVTDRQTVKHVVDSHEFDGFDLDNLLCLV